MLIDGEVVSNDVSFPFDLTAIALPPVGNTPYRFKCVRPILAAIAPYRTYLPLMLRPIPLDLWSAARHRRKEPRRRTISTVSIRFNESIDADLLDTSGITLTNLGVDGVLGGGDDAVVEVQGLQLSETGRSLFINHHKMKPSLFQVIIN